MTGVLRLLVPAVLSGLALSLAFPGWVSPGFSSWPAWIAWFALIPLFWSLEGRNMKESALAGWVAGFVFFASTLYWVAAVEELSFLRIPALIGLSCVLALYWMLWSLVVKRGGPDSAFLVAPAAWALLEILRGKLFTGFPWAILGASQYSMHSVFPAARYIGVVGISACIVAVNCALWHILRRDGRGPRAALSAVLMLASLPILSLISLGMSGKEDLAAPRIRASVLQGNFSEKEKWYLPGDELIARYEALSREAGNEGAQVMVWPETAVARDVISDPVLSKRIASIAARTGAVQIVGTILAQSGSAFYNAAYSVSSQGPQGAYMKMHLVPFGEYVPRWVRVLFPFVRKLTQGMEDYTAGRDPSLIPAGNGVQAGAAVCYEAIFPEHAAMLIKAGAEIFVNLTNDAWYGMTAASYQHALGPLSRAVECGRWVVRSANTGVSMIVSPSGQIRAKLGLFEKGVITADVGILKGRTFYSRFGDAVVVFYALAALAFSIFAGSKRSAR